MVAKVLHALRQRDLRVWLPQRRCHRCYATHASHDPSKLRNMALVAHIDSGKTTLTESILLRSKYLSSAGSVDTGSTTTDFLPAERERGITIQSASIPVRWKDWTFNLIDTPGHADFGMEVESASRVVDGAVVLIDAVEGVEAQTKGVWRQLDRYDVKSRILFLNKLDRAGASFRTSVLSVLANRLHPRPMALTLPVASFNPEDYARAEPGIRGIVDLVKWEVWKYDSEGVSSVHPLPRIQEELEASELFPPTHPLIPHLLPARIALLDNLAQVSEEMFETLLSLPEDPSSYLSLSASQILPHLRAATLRNEVLPVICGSAFRHVGTELLMNYVGELLPSPADVEKNNKISSSNAPLRALAWKVGWDQRKGWMTFVRVYSGVLKAHSGVLNSSRNEREKVGKLMMLYAAEAEEIDALPFGSVGAVMGLKHTRTGDTLTSVAGGSDHSSLRDILPPPAMMSVSVLPNSYADLQPVENALHALARTDPSVRVETQEGQLLVHGLGALHLEIVESRLREEWAVKFEFGRRRVSFRECLGPGDISKVSNIWSTELGGHAIKVEVSLNVRLLEDDEEGDRSGAATPASTLSSSPNTSLALSRLRIEVQGTKHPKESHASVLAGASATILRNIVRAAGQGNLMEPFIRLKISVDEGSVGRVVEDLGEHGGEVLDLDTGSEEDTEPFVDESAYIPPQWLSPTTGKAAKTLLALAPLSQMLDYTTRLRALSGGHGLYSMSNDDFRTVSSQRAIEILKELGRM
ncbi:P-loop containing nucleoside triphosphate hydrolase protein [Epithele typhae]|uniref:P-loop containing nucleoside triphosphate hydrolase protein n=1 Tax=Epithele typhae TaxID=378194 RepID=UPI002008CC33|nr:P-loop containing nucleoside triphosphate hydrolase protein [Epithele typhae]KAH9943497.1 P-loop containing nucleoside triphosphate hydrolase protein [Epithele typhae]